MADWQTLAPIVFGIIAAVGGVIAISMHREPAPQRVRKRLARDVGGLFQAGA